MIRTNPCSNGSPVTTNLTYEDYLKTSGDERYELLNGELFVLQGPSIAHQHVAMKLRTRLDIFVEDRNLGVVYSAPPDVVLSETDVDQPDLMFISSERGDIVTTATIQGAPDLLIEIRSDSTAERDEKVKRQLYAKCGVKVYWLVDSETWTLTVLLLGEDGYADTATFTEGQTLTSPMLEGLAADLDEIFLTRP